MTIINEIESALSNHRGRSAAICLGKHQFDRYCEWLSRLTKRRAAGEVQDGSSSARDAYLYRDRYVPVKRMSEADHLSIE